MQIRGVMAIGALPAALAVALSCAHTGPEIPVGPCSDRREMKPVLESACAGSRRASYYVGRVHEAILQSLGFPFNEGVDGLVAISYRDGPAVESVCWSGFGDQLEEAQLVDMARRAARVGVPGIACFEGHVLVHELVKEWKGPVRLPPGAERM